MSKFIALTAINLDAEAAAAYAASAPASAPADMTNVVALDDLERPIASAEAAEANAAPVAEAPAIYFPITLNTEDIREFYPRKGSRTGTRIVYKNGSARPVKETYEEVVAAMAAMAA